jgi:hypothetical protein
MTDDIAVQILRNLQNGQSEIKGCLDNLRSDRKLQRAALNEKLSGQLLSKMEIRNELTELRERFQRVERRLNLID